MLIIEGKLSAGVTMEIAEDAIIIELEKLKTNGVTQEELLKIKNKSETNIRFNDMTVLNKAMKLAYAWVLGDIELVNKEADLYLKVSENDIIDAVKQIITPTNCSTKSS